MTAQLRGKGLWAYAHGGLDDFEKRIGHALGLAPQMGATHIIFKVGNGPYYYEDRALEAATRIREAGLTPFAWVWLKLSDPDEEARIVARAFDDGYEGFVFDVEKDCRGRYEQATALGHHLEQLGVDRERLYLCSYPNIYSHRGGPPYNDPNGLPYDQMAAFCRGGTMPMAYGTFLRPPEVVLDEWTYGHHKRWCQERGDQLPVYPVLGPYTDEGGQVLMTPDEFAPWLGTLAGHSPTFFSLYAARSVDPAVAALVRVFTLGEGAEVTPPPEEEGPTVVVHSPALGFLRLRAEPTTASEEVGRIPHGTLLHSLEGDATAEKVNQPGKWLHVRTPEGDEGYVAAWYLRWPVEPVEPVEPAGPVEEEDTRRPVDDAPLPFGQSAWIYGVHMTSIDEEEIYRDDVRDLFHGTGRRGWVLFTEAIGCQPSAFQPDGKRRDRFWNWARKAGYGVIVRLNYGYHTAGTLPESARYKAFADTCARYAELYLKHPEEDPSVYTWVIVIGNEQNNPREWPREDHPPEPITPQRYASAFNLAYRAVKAVLPNGIVVPGAVDPYNYSDDLGIPPLDYFSKMLEGIEQLDGIALHTYTHGHDVGFITHLKKFDPGPLGDHYYDFQAYRAFMERIPARWRHLPVYITETNPLFKTVEPDWGWRDEDIGWISAAYEEIHRWNSTPHAQQIQALLLYRWAGDAWIMKGKGLLMQDFRRALERDYRWRA